jgi:hypothetical protein
LTSPKNAQPSQKNVVSGTDFKAIRLWETDDVVYIELQTKDFSASDQFDCFCVFEFKSLQAVRMYGKDSIEEGRMQYMAQYHRSHLSDEQYLAEMASLGLAVSIDIRNHGESLVKHFLR